jgi:hypothetical protein
METTQQVIKPPIKAPDFGEPWNSSGKFQDIAYTKTGMVGADSQLYRDRIIACVNACAGIADPAREIASLRDYAGRTHELATKVSIVVAQREAKQEELDSILSVIPEDAPCHHAETGETAADYILGLQKEVGRVHALYFNTSQQLEAMRDAVKAAAIALFRHDVEGVSLEESEELTMTVTEEDQKSLRAALTKLKPFLPKP